MSTLLFTAALLIPWVAGAIALRPLRVRLHLTQAGWLGYSYFLGATLLAVSAYIASVLPWLATTRGLITCLAALTLACTLSATLAAQRLPLTAAAALPPATGRERGLTALLLILIALHLGFAALELYWRPVFPWDAWQTWTYTAKAWYFNGAPIDMLPPHQWLNMPENGMYTAQGNHYPWLVPAQSWWLARMLGSWQETQILWPTLPASLALAMAVWGQAVAATRQRLAGPIAAWLLLSLPLLNTHISLAGYADLWLAGFSGLGLIAIARGLLEAHRGQLLLGTAALALGLLVKHDAIIWLTCGLLLVGLIRRRQLAPAAWALAAALLIGALVYGLSRLELQLNSDFTQYGPILWTADSWHLLWYLLPGALLLALLPQSPVRTTAKVFGLLLVLVLASQLVLFGATIAGSWIVTAASRLLLQVTPVLTFALVCLAATNINAPQGQQRWRTALAVSGGSIGALLIVVGWLTSLASTSAKPAPAQNFTAQQLRAVYGPMQQSPTQLLLAPPNEGRAIITTGPARIDATTFDLLYVDIEGTGQIKQTLFWRTADNPTRPFTRDLLLGAGPVILSEDDNWQGEITEAGLILFPHPVQPLALRGLHFNQSTPLALLQATATDWLTPNFWTQVSINRTTLNATASLPALPLLAGLWVVLCWAGLYLLTGATPRKAPMLATALLAWLMLDARWLHNSYHQAQATRAYYANTSTPQALDLGDDSATVELAQQARAILGEEPLHILLATEDPDSFVARRLKYALLPHPAHILTGKVSKRRAALTDAVIWLSSESSGVQAKCPRPLQSIEPALTTPQGVLCIQKPLASKAPQ